MAQFATGPTPAATTPEGQQDLTKGQVVRGAVDANRPASAAEGRRLAAERVRPGQGAAAGEDVPATEDEQREYERAMGALSKILYEDERTSASIVRQLTPEEKIGSVAKASMLTITQLDQKLDFDESIIAEFTQDVVDRIIDLYENVHSEEFSDQEMKQALGATWEGIMEVYGVDEEDYAELTAGLSDEEFEGYKSQYKEVAGDPY